MRVLFTSDWQAEFENLDLCRKVLDEIFSLKKKYGFSVLVHCGDVKRAYNPVDVRVVNAVVKMIGESHKSGLEWVINLGNHDRVGMYSDVQNWFPVLRKAGAKAIDHPEVLTYGQWELRMLPFRRSEVLLQREASDLAKGADKHRSVLVFHSDLKFAAYNVQARSDAGIRAKDLRPEKYLYCIGGHIHLQQQVQDRVWYVGSPFCTDWGEANQRKGYLLLDFETGELKRIRSRIPGWYDPSWPGFIKVKPEDWAGTRVRIHVPCSGVKDVSEQLHLAKRKAEKEYRRAEITVVPELHQEVSTKIRVRTTDSDERKVRIYVRRTCPEELVEKKEEVVQYLLEQLNQVGGMQRATGQLWFREAIVKNFLSFEDCSIRYEPGLTLVTGENRDWRGRSNGAGKSSYLQPVMVGLFGTTFKGQKHDAWKRRNSSKEDESSVKVRFRDAEGRWCAVWRGRRPVGIRVWINRKDVTEGNRPEQVQRLIENLTGYTWETLANTIYLDQARANVLLAGTEAERKQFLARLQNLERFEKALALVREEKSGLKEALERAAIEIRADLTEEKHLTHTYHQARKIMDSGGYGKDRYIAAKRGLKKALEQYKEWEEKWAPEIEKHTKRESEAENAVTAFLLELSKIDYRLADIRKKLDRLSGFKESCPTCWQRVPKEHKSRIRKELEVALEKWSARWETKIQEKKGYEKTKTVERQIVSELWGKKQKWETRIEELRRVEKEMAAAYEREKEQLGLLQGIRQQFKEVHGKRVELESKVQRRKNRLEMLKYAEQVLSRNGLPAFLNAQICPQLNKAAEFYAQLFAQKEIQVLFNVTEEGQLDVRVINAHGGERVQDQSQGEMRMASLITSFALREVAPKTNLLILDEPAEGLDSRSARQFARGLKEVVGRFGTILLTTHNPAIESELSGERMVTVVKEDGVSWVSEGRKV